MDFKKFFSKLEEAKPGPKVDIRAISNIIDAYHAGIGKVRFKKLPDIPGATPGLFLWLEEERTSPHEDPFQDVAVFVNEKYVDDAPMKRIIEAKELMHVFDAQGAQASDSESFRKLIAEIESDPMQNHSSEPYRADEDALWKSTLAIVPPWVRGQFIDRWKAKDITAQELATILHVPAFTVRAAMGDYYERALNQFVLE